MNYLYIDTKYQTYDTFSVQFLFTTIVDIPKDFNRLDRGQVHILLRLCGAINKSFDDIPLQDLIYILHKYVIFL